MESDVCKPGRQLLGEGAILDWRPDFLTVGTDRLFRCLMDELPLVPESFKIFGKQIQAPRLTSWHGDPGCVYRYSGQTYHPEPWTPTLSELRKQVVSVVGEGFNAVLANCYRDGADSLGWHSDDESELGPAPDDIVIASLSLGATRRFVLKHRVSGEKREFALADGNLLTMRGTTQQHWKHAVPKTRLPVGPRLNLTFRIVGR